MSTSSRLLSLLSLLQMPRTWSGSDLAARLEVSRRTVRRDIDRLRDLGYPVEGTLGAEGGYRLGSGTAVPPLLLDDDEAVAVVIGLRTAAGQAVAGMDEASVRALAKLEQVLPARLRARFAGLGASTSAFPSDGPTIDPSVLTTLSRAVSAHERLRFTYRGPGGTGTRRSVEPAGLVVQGRRWYLVAWDEDRSDWRTFRVDRLDDPWTTGRPFVPRALPGDASPAAWVRDQERAAAPTYRLVATVHASREEIGARVAGPGAVLEPLDGRRCRLSIEGDTLPWLAFRLLALDVDFEVHEPRELTSYLRTVLHRVQRATTPDRRVGDSDPSPGP